MSEVTVELRFTRRLVMSKYPEKAKMTHTAIMLSEDLLLPCFPIFFAMTPKFRSEDSLLSCLATSITFSRLNGDYAYG